MTGLQVVDTLPVSLDGCPDTWNVTSRDTGDTIAASDSWWLHLELYEVSYMWYSGLACCIVVVLGSVLSLVPGLQQEDYPDPDLLVPVMEVSITLNSYYTICVSRVSSVCVSRAMTYNTNIMTSST